MQSMGRLLKIQRRTCSRYSVAHAQDTVLRKVLSTKALSRQLCSAAYELSWSSCPHMHVCSNMACTSGGVIKPAA